MWKLTDINDEKNGPHTLLERFEHYILEKNLTFIVARGKCINQRQDILGTDKVTASLRAYAGCDFSMISFFNGKPSVPFIAASMDMDKGFARVEYLIDFNEEATAGKASPFYSKILGAFATNFFAAQPQINQLWFPFFIADIVGSNMGVKSDDSGTAILR